MEKQHAKNLYRLLLYDGSVYADAGFPCFLFPLGINSIFAYDSLHLAIAEVAKADVLLTTDDRLLKRAQKTNARIKVANPVTWLMEVTSNE